MHCFPFDVRDAQFIQLIIAVVLLHALAWLVPASSPLKPHVTLPELNAEMAYKLLPVVSVGVIALGEFSSHSPHFIAARRWGTLRSCSKSRSSMSGVIHSSLINIMGDFHLRSPLASPHSGLPVQSEN